MNRNTTVFICGLAMLSFASFIFAKPREVKQWVFGTENAIHHMVYLDQKESHPLDVTGSIPNNNDGVYSGDGLGTDPDLARASNLALVKEVGKELGVLEDALSSASRRNNGDQKIHSKMMTKYQLHFHRLEAIITEMIERKFFYTEKVNASLTFKDVDYTTRTGLSTNLAPVAGVKSIDKSDDERDFYIKLFGAFIAVGGLVATSISSYSSLMKYRLDKSESKRRAEEVQNAAS